MPALPGAWARSPGPAFVPEQVFAGASEGTGELKLLLRKARPFTVQSLGTAQDDGSFRLEQAVRFDGSPVETRVWVMRPTGSGTYTATLTGAAGPVELRTDGRRMTLRYPLTRWGLGLRQTLTLADDGCSIDNRGSVRLWGLRVGRLSETIRLQPRPGAAQAAPGPCPR